MKSFLAKLVVAASLFAVATIPANATLVIRSNPGGIVEEFVRAVETYRMRRESIVVDGPCMSACVLTLSLARDGLMCATPRASFHFHSAYSGPPGTAAYDDDGGYNAVMMDEVPESVAEYVRDHGGLTHKWIVLSGREMAKRVPICPAGTVKAVGEPNVLRKKYT